MHGTSNSITMSELSKLNLVACVTAEIAMVLAVLAATILLFVTEWLRVDVIALLIMLVLGWAGLVGPAEVFAGLSSNAVISVIGVMILGYGVDRSGVMGRLVKPLIKAAGSSESRIIAMIAAVVGGISAFMQNVGAAALFLPAVMRLSKTLQKPASRLLMPMGFAAILGGTLSMVGSSPLIILNDLMAAAGEEKFELFSVTPLGLLLLLGGIVYFLLLGRWVLPSRSGIDASNDQTTLVAQWNLPKSFKPARVGKQSPLIGRTLTALQVPDGMTLVALCDEQEALYSPWTHAHFAEGQILIFLTEEGAAFAQFCSDNLLQATDKPACMEQLLDPHQFGFAELVVASRSNDIGKNLGQVLAAQGLHVSPVAVMSEGAVYRRDLHERVLQAGDAVIVHGQMEDLHGLGTGKAFLPATPIEIEKVDPSQSWKAIGCFIGAIAMALGGASLSLSLMSGALAMVLLRVVTIDEAYRAVDWRTVFLLAGLIPLGVAMDKTGAAAYVAQVMMGALDGQGVLVILLAVAGLTTLFSLFMSNVAATVLLVPLVTHIGMDSGIDPRALALLVGVAASNSFILPTHQVNALLMGPGGYRNADYLKAGGGMTLLFIAIAVTYIYFVHV